MTARRLHPRLRQAGYRLREEIRPLGRRHHRQHERTIFARTLGSVLGTLLVIASTGGWMWIRLFLCWDVDAKRYGELCHGGLAVAPTLPLALAIGALVWILLYLQSFDRAIPEMLGQRERTPSSAPDDDDDAKFCDEVCERYKSSTAKAARPRRGRVAFAVLPRKLRWLLVSSAAFALVGLFAILALLSWLLAYA